MDKKLFNNQRRIRSIKVPTDKYHTPYSFFNVAAQQKARIELNGNAYKLYTYFSSFDMSYQEIISRKNIECKTGLSKDSYIKAFKELQEKGYIQKDPSTKNADDYIFIEDGNVIM